MQVDQEEGGHQKCHAEHTPEEEIDHTGAKAKVSFLNCVVVDWSFVRIAFHVCLSGCVCSRQGLLCVVQACLTLGVLPPQLTSS